jgi:hypothetical protein
MPTSSFSTAFPRLNLPSLLSLRVPRSSNIVYLELLTLSYLALPALIWLNGWLKLPLALLLSLGLLFTLRQSWLQTRRHCHSPNFKSTEADLPLIPLLIALGLGLLWGLYSGAGGFLPTSPDWGKHYAIMRDLSEGTWPISYDLGEQKNTLIFYLAYYLPAVAVAKLFGWWAGCLTLCLWTCLGVALAISWFTLLVGRHPILATLLFIFANGLDFLGERWVSGGPITPGNQHIDWWAGFVNLPGHYSQLAWAPQHSLAAWMVTGLLAVQLSSGRSLSHALFLAALAFFWSPFTLIGFIPLALVACVLARGSGIFSLPNFFALALFTVTTLFYLSRSHSSPHGFLWELENLHLQWPKLLLFHLLEWGLFFFFARELRTSTHPWLKTLFWTSGLCLLLLPLYSYGYSNDWTLRATIPALFLLWTGVVRSLLHYPSDLEKRLLWLLVIIGFFGSLHETSRTWCLPSTTLIDQSLHQHVPELDEPYRSQYLGQTDSFFFQYLARPLQPKTLP